MKYAKEFGGQFKTFQFFCFTKNQFNTKKSHFYLQSENKNETFFFSRTHDPRMSKILFYKEYDKQTFCFVNFKGELSLFEPEFVSNYYSAKDLEVFYSFFATFSVSNETTHVLVNSLNKKPFVQEELHDLCKRYECLQKIKLNINILASEFSVQPDLIEKAITEAISLNKNESELALHIYDEFLKV